MPTPNELAKARQQFADAIAEGRRIIWPSSRIGALRYDDRPRPKLTKAQKKSLKRARRAVQ